MLFRGLVPKFEGVMLYRPFGWQIDPPNTKLYIGFSLEAETSIFNYCPVQVNPISIKCWFSMCFHLDARFQYVFKFIKIKFLKTSYPDEICKPILIHILCWIPTSKVVDYAWLGSRTWLLRLSEEIIHRWTYISLVLCLCYHGPYPPQYFTIQTFTPELG